MHRAADMRARVLAARLGRDALAWKLQVRVDPIEGETDGLRRAQEEEHAQWARAARIAQQRRQVVDGREEAADGDDAEQRGLRAGNGKDTCNRRAGCRISPTRMA